MAELMKRQYGLLALSVRLDMAAPEMRVVFELEADADGDRMIIGEWSCSTGEMNIPRKLERSQTLYQGPEFRLPDYLPAAIRDTLQAENLETEPLWLHLAKPSGYLALIPWEMLLQPTLQRPILRLPEFLTDPPKESPPWLLEVALCATMPAAKEAFFLVDYLRQIAQRAVGVPGRFATVHIFTDSQWVNDLRGMLDQDNLLGEHVRIHDPTEAARFAVPEPTRTIRSSGGQIENPWLLWMGETLRERRIDVMHFIGHGYLARETGALALAESPLENADRRMARFVGSSELITFLTQIGAWSTILTSPEQNYSEIGLRLLTDTMAQHRPGTMAHHEYRLDGERTAVGQLYNFLFANAPPPITPALSIYCHPARLTGKTALEFTGGATQYEPDYWANEDTPQWVAATERYIEQSRLDAVSKGQGPGERSAVRDPRVQEEIDSYERTLLMIQEIVAEEARSATSDSSSTSSNSSGSSAASDATMGGG